METAGETARSVSRGLCLPLQQYECCIYELECVLGTESGKEAVSVEGGFQCQLVQQLRSPSSYRNLGWWKKQQSPGVEAGAEVPLSEQGFLLSALNQL